MKRTILISVAFLALQSLCAADEDAPCTTTKPCDPCFYPTCPPGTHISYPPTQENGCPGCPKCVKNECTPVFCTAMVCPEGTYAKPTTKNGCPDCDECVDCLHLPCALPKCATGEYLKDTTQSNGCPSCPICAKCTPLFCPAVKCVSGKTYSELGFQSNGCPGCPSCIKCPIFHCPLIKSNCDEGYYLQNTTLSNGCLSCPKCAECPKLSCRAAVCEPGKTYPQMGTLLNGCRGCPECVPCKPHVCSQIYCPNSTQTTDENGCPGCPKCNFTPIAINPTNA